MLNLKNKMLMCLIAVLILSLFVVSFSFIGCKQEVTAVDKKHSVSLLWLGAQTPYGPPFISNYQFLANGNGWDSFVFDGKFDAALQATQMDDAIAMKPDLIDLVAMDSSAMSQGIKKAYDNGILVLMDHGYALDADKQYTVGYTGPNDYMLAQNSAELLNNALGGKGKVVMLEGAAGQKGAIDRTQGFLDKLKELNSQIEVIATQPAQWDKATSTKIMADWLVSYGDTIDGVYGQDDTIAIGAWIAIQEAGKAKGDIIIVGSGGSREGLAAVNEGTIYGTVTQDPVTGSTLSIKTIEEIFNGGLKVGDQIKDYFRYMDIVKITKENVEKFLPGVW